MGLQWYLVKTRLGHEPDVAATIQGDELRRQLGARIGRVVIPRRAEGCLLYPGYVVVELVLCAGVCEIVRSIAAVIDFVSGASMGPFEGVVNPEDACRTPAPLLPFEVDQILKPPVNPESEDKQTDSK